MFRAGRWLKKAIAIENNILAKTDGYIKKYDILSEKVEDNLYKTKIRALVSLKALETDLRDLDLLRGPELEKPRVVVNLYEQIDKDYSEEGVAKQSLSKSLMNQGFVILSDERKDEAQLSIDGKAGTYPFQTGGLGGFVSYRARLTLQVTKSGTKDIILTASKEASGLGGNNTLAGLKSLEVVGELTGDEIGPDLAEAWARTSNLLVFVEEVKSFTDVERVRKHLSAQPGVKDLILRLYDEEMAQFEIQLGSIKAAELASQLESSRTLPLKILEASPQTLRVKLK